MKDGKYEEALERARAFIERGGEYDRQVMESIFPELKESEDERIRKLLVWQVYRNIEDETNDLAQSVYDGIKGHDPDLEESIEDWKKCLAWLEKQKEQQPAEWREEDERNLSTIVGLINVHYRDYDIVRDEYPINAHNLIDWLNSLPERFSLRPKQEWSEEDEKLLDTMIDMATNSLYEPLCPRGKMIALLKSLRPQPHWKPSEEQMEILQYLCDHSSHPNPDVMPTLESLYHDLQKLL